MKKSLVITALFLFCAPMIFGNIVTNNNQSALFGRQPARFASTYVDAVYYNPAGLVFLEDGFHLSIHNQAIFQTKTVTNFYPLLNDSKYVGEVNVPIFPTLFAVYKKDKLALSFGFGPNAGGGTADFKEGLPSFETGFATLPSLLSLMGVPTTQYSLNMAFKGSSVYYGFQVNASYAFHDRFSAAVGVRYIMAKNTYEGYIEDIMINPMHPLINPSGSMMSAKSFFTMAGMPTLAALVSDKAVDAEQTGSAITPILSMNVMPIEDLLIAVKYEFNTKLELENKTARDDTGMFPDGETFRSDIPGILSLGVEYAIVPQFRAAFSYNYYFDKNADWEGREDDVNSNTFDVAFGIEYDITPMVILSTGYLRTQIDVDAGFQSDFSHELSSDTFGFGGRLKATQNLDVDLALLVVSYSDYTVQIPYGQNVYFPEKYSRTTWSFMIGAGYNF